jgi:hypothetical protein
MSVTYTAVLPVRDETVDFLAGLLAAERLRRGTRSDTRSLSVHDQAVLVLRWLLDGTRMRQLARDNGIGKSTGYDYLHEGIDVLAVQAPSLHGALLAAKAAGYGHVGIDGTPIATDRVAAPGPTPGVDVWWSGKHAHHGGNVHVVTAPDDWPLWTSPVRPGREHDTTALRAHTHIRSQQAGHPLDVSTDGGLGDVHGVGDLAVLVALQEEQYGGHPSPVRLTSDHFPDCGQHAHLVQYRLEAQIVGRRLPALIEYHRPGPPPV